MSVVHAVLGLVLLQRGAELLWAAANTRRLRAEGAIEIDGRGYPWLVLLHIAWLASLWALVPAAAAPSWPLLALYGVLQLGRVWVLASLGRRWTTRVMIRPGELPVRRGPYRWLRHPNYAIVIGEIAVLPLAFGAVAIAAVFSVANLALLARRIHVEERAWALSRGRGRTRLSDLERGSRSARSSAARP